MTGEPRAANVVVESTVYRAADWLLTRVDAAWTSSRIAGAWRIAPADRARFWSVAVLAAAVTATAAAPFGTTPRPLGWLVPALAAVVAAIVLMSSRNGSRSV